MEIIVNRDMVLFDMNSKLVKARRSYASFLSSPLWNLGQIADIGIITEFVLNCVKTNLFLIPRINLFHIVSLFFYVPMERSDGFS